ncbi:MAG: TolC family protein, partial [Gemmatimonas sp.]
IEADTARILTLRTLLEATASQHPSIGAAASRVRAAQGARTTARTFANPVLGFQVEGAPFPGSSAAMGVQQQHMTTATLPLEPFYQRGARIEQANANVRGAQADAAYTRQQLSLDAAAAYYRTAMAQVEVATTRDIVTWLDSVVWYNRVRVTEGATSEGELLRSELERDRMAAEEVMQRAELLRAQAALRAFLPPSREFAVRMLVALHDTPLALPIASTPRSSESGALARRPDVQAARERAAALAAGVSIERSLLVRDIGATLGLMASAGTTSLIAGVSLPLPLFDSNRGQIVRAQGARDASQLELLALERAAAADVQGAFDAAMLLTERTALLARRDSGGFLSRADESRRIALGAYREGAAPLLQVIDAARAWADARLTFYRLIFAQHQSVLGLLAAEGHDLLAALPPALGEGGAR